MLQSPENVTFFLGSRNFPLSAVIFDIIRQFIWTISWNLDPRIPKNLDSEQWMGKGNKTETGRKQGGNRTEMGQNHDKKITETG